MQDSNEAVYPSLPPELKAKVDSIVDLMFSQNTMLNPHPLLALLRTEQKEITARLLAGSQQ